MDGRRAEWQYFYIRTSRFQDMARIIFSSYHIENVHDEYEYDFLYLFNRVTFTNKKIYSYSTEYLSTRVYNRFNPTREYLSMISEHIHYALY